MNYEQWMQQEIARLRAEAERANAEAEALEQAHSRWTKANGRENAGTNAADQANAAAAKATRTRLRQQDRGSVGKDRGVAERHFDG
jgi:hypothetical protein